MVTQPIWAPLVCFCQSNPQQYMGFCSWSVEQWAVMCCLARKNGCLGESPDHAIAMPLCKYYLLSQPYNCPEYVTLLFRDIPWLPTYEVKSRLSSWHQRSVHFLSVCFLSLQFTLIFTVYFLSFSFPMYFYQNWFTNCIKNILYSVFHSKNTY